MKTIILVLTQFLIISQTYSQSFEWAKQIGGEGSSNVTMKDIVVTDNDGVFIVGSFVGTIDFDPSNTVNNKIAIGTDGFAARYDSNGNLIWVYTTNSVGNEEISVATFCNALGLNMLNVVVKTGSNAFNMSALNSNDGSLFASSPIYYDQGGVTLNINGINKTFSNEETAFYVVGSFDGTLQFGSIQILNQAYTAAFCVKFTVNNFDWFSLNWAKSFGTQFTNEINDVVINGQNTNPVIVGSFQGTIDFGSGSIHTSAGNRDVFVATLNSSDGTIVGPNAVFTFGSTTSDIANSIYRSAESFSPILIGGKFGDTADFAPGNGISNLTSTGSYDGFLVSYATSPANDYSLNWAKKIGEEYDDEVTDVVYNSNVYYSARIQNSNLGTSIYLGSLDSNGNERTFGGQLVPNLINSQNYVTGLEMNTSNELYCSGFFGVTTDFDPGVGEFNLNPVGNAFDGFIQKMSGSNLDTDEFNYSSLKLHPNPANNYFNLTTELTIEKVEVYSMFGQLVKTFEQQNQYVELNIEDLSNGVYLMKITSDSKTITKKLIKN
jgi:Secretion system C-terminal sorting domain